MNKKLLLAALTIIPLVLLLATTARGTDNLVVNGDFETPVLTKGWDIFPSGTPDLGWIVEWYDPSSSWSGSAPTPARLELHRGVIGPAYGGSSQYTELDSDWDGPGGSINGEPASVKIYQDIPTCVGPTQAISTVE